jgi:ribonuclease G
LTAGVRAAELIVGRIGERRCAVLREDGRAVELYLEPAIPQRRGRIALCRVLRVLAGIEGAIVDTALGRHALVPASDLVLPGESAIESAAPIADRLRAGRELLVQIVREADDPDRGDLATAKLEIAGRRLVLLPLGIDSRVSRRIADAAERERLGRWLSRQEPGAAWVARTAAAGATEAELDREAAHLVLRLEEIRSRAASARAPGPVDEPIDFLAELVREAPPELERLVVDGPDEHERMLAVVAASAPELRPAVRLHRGPPGVVAAFALDADFREALAREIGLPSGGTVVVETTAAAVTADVNTGSDADPGATERANVEAAREIARQLRLRDVGGQVVVDFAGGRAGPVPLAALAEALRSDPARTRLHGPTAAGLVLLAREARGSPIGLASSEPCVRCRGSGRVPRADFPFGH